MKQLSIEQKAKRYDEAIEIAKRINNEQQAQPFNIMTRVFPELKESEDERIRKELLQIANENDESFYIVMTPNKRKRLIAWLEKQGEHAKFRDSIQVGDKVTRNQDGVLVNLSQLKRVAKPAEEQGEQKPAWSEEDERKINYLIALLQNSTMNDNALRVMNEEVENWLKSLRPQNTWKPSDEQMEILQYLCENSSHPNKKVIPTLKSLFQDLKKLREE